MKQKKYTNYISNVDLFQIEFDRLHKKSRSQEAEIRKYQQIAVAMINEDGDKPRKSS